MIKIKTPIDILFDFIEDHSPVSESRIPKHLKTLDSFENHLKILESNGMIEVKLQLFSNERIFVFKTNERSVAGDPWSLTTLKF